VIGNATFEEIGQTRDFHAQEKNRAVSDINSKLHACTEKDTCPRDLDYVAKANITPDEEFKTDKHSIKRETSKNS